MKIRLTGKNIFGSNQTGNTKYCILLFILAFSVPLFTAAKEVSEDKKPPSVGSLKDISASQEDGKLTVTMKTDRLMKPQAFRLENPSRLVVDFQNTVNKVTFMKLPLNAPSAKQLRVSQFQRSNPQIARVVFDLEKDFGTHNITQDNTSVQVTLYPAKPGTNKTASGIEKKAESPAVTPASAAKTTEPVKTADSSEKPEAAGVDSSSLKKAESPAVTPVGAAKTIEPVKTAVSSEKPEAARVDSSSLKKAESPAVTPVSAAKTIEPVKAASSSQQSEIPKVAFSSLKKAESPDVTSARAAESIEPVEAAVSSQQSEIPKVAFSSRMKAESPAVSPVPANIDSSKETELKKSGLKMSDEKAKEIPALIASLSPMSPLNQSAPPPAPPAVSQSSQISRFSGQLLTLDFVELPLVDFFRVMSEEAGINIVLDPKVKGDISIKVEKLPWDQIFDMVLVNYSLDKQIEGNLIRIAHKSTLQEEAKQQEALKKAKLLAADLETRVKRLNYAKAEDLMSSLEDLKTVRGNVVHDERTNSLVMTDIPSELDKMMQLITTLDIPQPQVEIEARIVSAARDFAREIGIQFGFVQGNLERVTVGGPNTFGTIGGTRPSATPNSTYIAGNPATGRGAAEDEVGDIGSVSTGGAGNYNVNLPATKAFGGLGISVGNIFDTFLLDAALTAGETKGLAKLISQPKVTAQNNSPAVITQGTRFPVLVNSNNTITVQFFNAALTLTVTPQITYEGNIVLDLKVENNTADWGRNVGGVPSIRISESASRVLVSDGGTTVIGGILIDDESNSGDKVPGLGDLPLVGNLFRRSSVSRSTQEVLFFVTPRIVN
ncbi:MAG: type IV pilus secretin PilQ [Acidobacteria bacterium]|nr:type IV pilus secretin PilQ [Acidobacteriota bacterium]